MSACSLLKSDRYFISMGMKVPKPVRLPYPATPTVSRRMYFQCDNARRFVVAHIACRGIGIVAMLTGPIRLEPICGNVLFLRLQPRDNDPLHCMCKLYGQSLKQAITILVEFREFS